MERLVSGGPAQGARPTAILLFTLLAVSLPGCARTPESSVNLTKVDLERLPVGTATFDRSRGELILELAPIDVPAEGMIVTPATRVDIPVSGFVHSARSEVVDPQGKPLPPSRLHHFNVIDPSRRELFAPIALRLFAASKETGSPSVPQRLVGMPLVAGQRIILKAMLHNSEAQPLRGARARVVLGFAPGGRTWPLFQAYPMQLDVLFPVGAADGTKSFDLPPGHFEESHEARPAVAGTLVGIGGHVHDFADYLQFSDKTTGEVLWRGIPYEDEDGTVSSMPVEKFYRWYRLGVRLEPTHVYEVRVAYDNPTGEPIPFGGMGVVGGLFVPDRGTRWPGVDTADAAYREDLANQLRDGNTVGEMGMMMNEHHAHRAADTTAAPMHQPGPHHHH